ncbi:MAG: PRC-barrel domain-containing protein [Gaiella sp.]
MSIGDRGVRDVPRIPRGSGVDGPSRSGTPRDRIDRDAGHAVAPRLTREPPIRRRVVPHTEIRLADLVTMPVRIGGAHIGTVEDVALNGRLDHVVGVDVVHAGRRYFVPWSFLLVGSRQLSVATPSALRGDSGLSLIFSAGPRLSGAVYHPRLRVGEAGEIQPGRGE